MPEATEAEEPFCATVDGSGIIVSEEEFLGRGGRGKILCTVMAVQGEIIRWIEKLNEESGGYIMWSGHPARAHIHFFGKTEKFGNALSVAKKLAGNLKGHVLSYVSG